MKQILTTIIVVALLISTAGCAGFTNWYANNGDTLQTAIDIAVATTIDAHPNDAVVIGRMANDVMSAVDSAQASTLADLNKIILSKINLPTLSNADRIVLTDLLRALEKSLTGYFVQQNITDVAKQLVVVSDICKRVMEVVGSPSMLAYARQAKLNAARTDAGK